MMKMLPYEVFKNNQGRAMVKIKKAHGKYQFLKIEEVYAKLIHQMKINAERMIGMPIKSAVINVPVNFKDE